MRDLSNELRKIAREQWDELQAEVDEKELKRMDAWGDAPGDAPKHGPNVQALIEQGIVRFEADGSAVFPAGKGGAEQVKKYFEAWDKDQELDKK